jgi:hypothetical protein
MTAFSVPPAVCACDHAALPKESNPIKHHMQVFFIGVLFVFIVEILKELTRAWQIGRKNDTTLGMEGKNPIGGETAS